MTIAVSRRRAGPAPRPVSDADLDLLLLIRHFELKLLDLFGQGQLNGTTHTCLGQEYVPVALRTLLGERDQVFSNHRGHGHYLARFDDPEGLLAEIMGRRGAVCNGVGGSQHIRRGRYLSTGIQGQSLPVAVGVGLHLARTEPGALVAVHIGDGTWGEGAVYEALNMARLWRVPMLVLVENNHIAQSTPTHRQLAGTIEARARAFDVDYVHTSTRDVSVLRELLQPLVALVREERRPLVVEFDTARLGPHSKGDDTRPDREIEQAARRDWLPWYADSFGARFDEIDRRQRLRVDTVALDVLNRPLSGWDDSPCRP